ncbi:MAG: RagB/SusD family nutrient uptake outer membrane protein [Muribaculaceae bacterium]|nr:RagB/SusD family nutrient uptake outer membrane protein [Muribaculaceae bacterium]
MTTYNSNKLRNIIAALAILGGASMLFTSCEDTLEMPSYTKDDVEFAFADENNADLFIQGIYRGLVHEEFYRQANTGEMTTIAAEDAFEGNKHYISNYAYDPTAPYVFSTTYGESYKKIEACNISLYRLGKMEETDKVKSLKAEAVALRAFLYFNLIRLFGDVPFITQPLEVLDIDDPDVIYPKRYDRDKIYDYVIDEMVETMGDLPWYSECGYTERINRNSACGLLARICLHAAGYSLRWNLETNDPSTLHMGQREDQARIRQLYQIADDALAEVMARGENSLIQSQGGMSGFQFLFFNFDQRNFGAVAPEMMFSLARLGDNVGSTTLGVYVGTPGGSQYAIYGQRRALQCKLPTYYVSFDPADTRRDVTCCDYNPRSLGLDTDAEVANAGTTYSSICSGKYRIQWQVAPNAAAERNLNIPMLRYSDVLLMYAETQNYLNNGPTGAAIAALQQVRDRAGIGSMPIPGGKDAFQDALLQERMWELSDEFLLRTDLVRMNLLDREVNKAIEAIKAFSKREGDYSGIATYRLYKFAKDENKYGTDFLTVDFIDITDPAEEAIVAVTNPNANAGKEDYVKALQEIAAKHGKDGNAIWYPCNMFMAWDNNWNKNGRLLGGFRQGAENNQILVGNTIAQKPTGYQENKNEYPDWIQGPFGLYFGYKHNQTELSPFANQAAGHPLVDNPRLTQLPGYPGYTGVQ